jgi:hypothetical protein
MAIQSLKLIPRTDVMKKTCNAVLCIPTTTAGTIIAQVEGREVDLKY